MSLVLDSSVALAWVYPEETTASVEAVFEAIARGGGWVPGLWRLEVANVLEMGVRRGRHDRRFLEATLTDLARLPLRTDSETDLHAWGATATLAAQRGLTLYDAAYLELARRKGVPLASLDQALCTAARAEGVEVLAG